MTVAFDGCLSPTPPRPPSPRPSLHPLPLQLYALSFFHTPLFHRSPRFFSHFSPAPVSFRWGPTDEVEREEEEEEEEGDDVNGEDDDEEEGRVARRKRSAGHVIVYQRGGSAAPIGSHVACCPASPSDLACVSLSFLIARCVSFVIAVRVCASCFRSGRAEEGQDEYEKDGWMVDGDEEEEEGGDGEEEEGGGEEGPGSDEERREKKKKKRRKREEEEDELDEDDYALLQESGVGGFHRPAKKDKKFRRLKKARHMGGDEDGLLMDDEEDEEGGMRAQQRVEREIFGDEDVPEDFQEREGRGEEEELEEEDGEEDEEEEDEMADFIVEGGVDDTDEHGRRRRKKKKKGTRMPGVTSEALLEAQDIFGDVADLLERRRVELERQRREGGEGGAGGYYYEDGMGTEGGEEYGREGAGGASALSKQYEPSLLEAKYMTERDEAIRARDVPERLQALWDIQQWNRHWLLLQRRKRSLRSAYERPRVDEDEEAERQGVLHALAMQGVLHTLDCALSEPA
ncbi:unnamed protein product, partial [Closterium sp. NIES-53]